MIVLKPAAVLLALGLSGWLGVAVQSPSYEAAGMQAAAEAASPTELPDYEALRLAAENAVRERVVLDLDDAAARVDLPRISVTRTSLRSLEARGEGIVAMPGARPIPVDIVVAYDVIDQHIDAVDYTARAVEAELTPVDHAVRAAIARRIGERIAGDFRGQPARFELLEVEGVEYGKHRTQLRGAGVTDFGAEGQAYTPFVATLDKHTGELVDLQYELLQEDAPAPVVAAGI